VSDAAQPAQAAIAPARGRERWVINKVRALGSWYTKGLDRGSLLRTALNRTESLEALRDLISGFFFSADFLVESDQPHRPYSPSSLT
jgi:hypothetical protein